MQNDTKEYVFAIFLSSEKLETVNTASANETSLLITLPATDDQAKF